jgi:two-component system, NarL family, nitrate/nitrite response regulator NarL
MRNGSREGLGKPAKPRCILADDHPALVAALVDLLEANGYEVVATARDGLAALEAARVSAPDVALVDFRMPHLAGAELVRRLRASSPGTRIAVYTAETDPEVVTAVLTAGADAVVLKESPLTDLLRALGSVLAGRPYVDAALAGAAIAGRARGRGTPNLTPREVEVLGLLAEGLSHEAIAKRLEIGPETVRTHARKAADRLGARTRTHAVATAIRQKLL